ncbi:MAG: DUF4214 domain-containing protein [Clostridiales bacterium]|nr:DUF4214 domain-containing protein [Clostridiales bacterium]
MLRKRVVASVVLAASIVAAPVHLAQKRVVRADADVVSGSVEINETNFPDDEFRKYIKIWDTDYDGFLSEQEGAVPDFLYLSSLAISDLTGIKYLTKAQRLFCESNNLTELDVSEMKDLQIISCDDNDLTSLNVSGCTALEQLDCSGNQKLELLDVSGLTNLTELCFGYSGVKTLNASGCSSLKTLTDYTSCPLEVMNLSGTAVESLLITINSVKEVDVSGCTKLTYLRNQSENLEKVNFSGCTALTTLYLNDGKLTELDISTCPNLAELYFDYNQVETFTMDSSVNTNLYYVSCNNNQLSALDFSGCEKLHYLYCVNNQLETLNVDGCTNLFELSCVSNKLHILDTSTCSELRGLYCQFNLLEYLKISGCAKLENLSCFGNQLENVNISDASMLMYLYENQPASPQSVDGIEFYTHTDGSFFLSYDRNTKIATSAPKSITVTFYANSGSGSMDPIVCNEYDIITLPECGFTPPSGYLFDKWDRGNPGDKIGVSVNTVIMPVWKLKEYTITVTTDGNGTASASATVATNGTEIFLTATPNEGYQLKEWQVIAGGVTVWNDKFVVADDNVEIKAIFELIPTTPEPGPDTPTPEPDKDPSFEDFVERLYVVALGRPSEAEGKAYWVEQVVKNGFTGADCARFFMLGAPEFLGRGLTDDEFVEVLYKTYFDRDSEPDGKAYWLGRLASGTERAVLVEEFIESVEWCNVCAGYGVKSGAQYHKATVPSKNAVKFATRLYTCCLGRDPEAEGLEYWALALTNLDATGYQAASLFFTLPEFVGLKTTNEEYLTRLYTTFMGRDPEADGFAYWLGLLNGGTDRVDVMKAFAGCPEFQEICNQYGIVRGEI